MSNPAEFAEPLQQVDRTYVLWRGRKLSYFGGCDYFRFSSHPRILKAVTGGLAKYGLNVAASRRTTGNHKLYLELEKAAARFFGAEKAALVSNGYLANLVAAQALRGQIGHVLIDERAHSSLRDAALFLRCRVTQFRHRDYEHAARVLARLRNKNGAVLMTDGLFAQDGSLAPVREYRQALGAEVMLWIDDSHAAGVLGARGQGSVQAAGLARHNLVQTVTFSKAFGVYGGAVLCDEVLLHGIVERSNVMTGNTPLPLPLAAAALEALKLLRARPEFRKKLRENIAAFWNHLGAGTIKPSAPIVSLTPANPDAVKRALLAAGIFPSFIRYPGGPEQGHYRFALSSEHTREQIAALAEVVGEAEIEPGDLRE